MRKRDSYESRDHGTSVIAGKVEISKKSFERQSGDWGALVVPDRILSRSFALESVARRRLAVPAIVLLNIISGGMPSFGADSTVVAKPAHHLKSKAKTAGVFPAPELLRPQPEPDCIFTGSVSSPITTAELRQKLDYETQCYRQSEFIVRTRLQQLQASVQQMIDATKRRRAAR